jgi:uncharacterized protein
LKDVMPVIRAVPDARYLVVNVANSVSLTQEDTALLQGANVLMDTSGRALTNLAGLISTVGKNKFAFGTHAPVLDYLTGLLRIESMRDNEADAQTKELLRSGNARNFLKL